jgi:hypothetical protein
VSDAVYFGGTDADPNWTSYFASSGAYRSSANGTACTSLDGRTAHHHRARAGNSATQGFLWKNTSDQCVMSLTPDTGNLFVRSLVQTSNINVGQTLTANILKGSLDYSYLSNVPSLATSAQGSFGSNTSVWSLNNCVKGSLLLNTKYPIVITSTAPRLGLLWNGGTTGLLDFGFSTSAFQGNNGAFARIRADDTNYSANLSFQTRTPGSSNMLTRMYVQSTGNVDVGTTSPGSLLDVAGTGSFTGVLTCSNGIAMKTSNWITSVPDNANRMYFAQSAVTVFSSPTGTYSFYDKTSGAYSMQLTSNFGWRNPNGDPGLLVSTSYGTPATILDIYGLGQFANGTFRAVISGSFSPTTFKICKPSNNNLLAFTDLITVDGLTTTCTASNFTAQNNISCGNNATISGKINCSTYDNAGANINFMGGSSTSNLVLYADGSAVHMGGIVCSTTQISSNVFLGDSTISHVNNHNSTGYALTQSSGGLTTINAITGNSIRLAVNGSLTAKVSRYDWSLGYDVNNLPAGAALGAGPCIVSRSGGWATMYLISGSYELGIPQADLWETSTNMGGELTVYFKNTSTTAGDFCMVRYYISQTFGNVLDFAQIDFCNNNMSVNNAYVFNNGFYVQLNINASQCYASWVFKGVL